MVKKLRRYNTAMVTQTELPIGHLIVAQCDACLILPFTAVEY